MGPPPASRIAVREDVLRRRTLLAGDLAGALNGEKAVVPRLEALHAELHALGVKIFEQHVEALLDEAAEADAAVHAAAAAFLAACEKADGLRDAWMEAQTRAVNGGDGAREAALRGGFSQIERLERPRLAAGAGSRARHAAEYRRRLAWRRGMGRETGSIS